MVGLKLDLPHEPISYPSVSLLDSQYTNFDHTSLNQICSGHHQSFSWFYTSTSHYISVFHGYKYNHLLGGFNPSEKYDESSVGMMT